MEKTSETKLHEQKESNDPFNDDVEQAFIRIVEAANGLAPLLSSSQMQDRVKAANDLITRKILFLIRRECPLLVAVAGGGSVGKSTFFNFLAGGKFSGVKPRAGYTRRTLAAINPAVARSAERMNLLFELFKKNSVPTPLKSPDEMLAQGEPRYVESDKIPEGIALLDTPDFDTGNTEDFANRAAAQEILAVSDVLLYLFTNQTYNNKTNLDFVRSALLGLGRRKVVLIYRCSRALPEEDVKEHMDTVLQNLFPDSADWRSEALGLYRMDESDAVVSGDEDPAVHPLQGCPDLMSLLEGIDIATVRGDILRSQCQDVLRDMAEALQFASLRRDELQAYQLAVDIRTKIAARESLKTVPQGMLMEQFNECWRAAQPRWIRAAHWTERKIGKGFKAIRGVFSKKAPNGGAAVERVPSRHGCADFIDSRQKLMVDLSRPSLDISVPAQSEDANKLREVVKRLKAASDRSSEYEYGKEIRFIVFVPSVFEDGIDNGVEKAGEPSDEELEARAEGLLSDTSDTLETVMKLVAEARQKMSFWEKTKEGMGAVVAALPAVASVTWVVSTSDTVIGPGLMAKLVALFGWNDLWACISIPASLGLDEVNARLLKDRLLSLYETWLHAKAEPIRKLIGERITGPRMERCASLLNGTERPYEALRDAIDVIRRNQEDS